MKDYRTLVGLISISLCLLLNPGFANLVYNGSFEIPANSTNWWGSHPTTWYAGESFDGRRYVSSGSIDIVRGTHVGVTPFVGNQMLDLHGRGSGAIYQDINIGVAGTYTLSFAMNGNYGWEVHYLSMIVSLVNISSGNPAFSGNYTHNPGNGWVVHTATFSIATPGVYRLSFVSTSPTNEPGGPFIDDVSLVPEPASLLGLGVGLASLLMRRRRYT